MTRRVWVSAGAIGVVALLIAIASIGHLGDGFGRADARAAAESKAVAALESRLSEDPYNYVVAGRLVSRYVLRFQERADPADIARAEEVARALLAFAPDTAAAHARLSAVLLTQHRFAEALGSAEAAVAADSGDVAALAAFFDAAFAAGRYASAEQRLRMLPSRGLPRHIREVQWLSAMGEADDAFHSMRRACRDLADAPVPEQVVAWCLTELAGLQWARAGADSAAALYEGALQVRPGYRGALEGLADIAYARGQWRRASELYESIATDVHADIYLRLAEAHTAMGNEAAAAQFERRFLVAASKPEAEPLYAHALAIHHAVYVERLDTALAIIERDVARRPSVESYDVLTWVRFRRGELREALAASDAARRWGDPTPTMDYHRARVLEALGEKSRSADLLAGALAEADLLDPHALWDARDRGLISS